MPLENSEIIVNADQADGVIHAFFALASAIKTLPITKYTAN